MSEVSACFAQGACRCRQGCNATQVGRIGVSQRKLTGSCRWPCDSRQDLSGAAPGLQLQAGAGLAATGKMCKKLTPFPFRRFAGEEDAGAEEKKKAEGSSSTIGTAAAPSQLSTRQPLVKLLMGELPRGYCAYRQLHPFVLFRSRQKLGPASLQASDHRGKVRVLWSVLLVCHARCCVCPHTVMCGACPLVPVARLGLTPRAGCARQSIRTQHFREEGVRQ